MKKSLLILLLPFVLLLSCAREDHGPVAAAASDDPERLVLDVDQLPFQHLSEYRFFKGPIALHRPVPGLVPYEPINALFTDYAHKLRFVWMPRGAQATYTGDHHVLDFPDGAVLVKTFYYDRVLPADTRRIIETRIMFKRDGHWNFANYVWNAEQTEATLDMDGSTTPVAWTDEGGRERAIEYRIPSRAECQTCHKVNEQPIPIGPKPQNLNRPFAYPGGVQNQLDRWTAEGYLSPVRPKRIATVPRWDDAQADMNDRVRAYVDMNCAHCHSEGGHCDYRPMRFAFAETADPANLGVCVPPDDALLPQHSHIVSPGNVPRSLLHYRMASTNAAEAMPLLGRSIVHEEGLALITAWIENMETICD